MKRTLTLLTMLTAFAATGMAQSNNSNNSNNNSSTPQQALQELSDCLDSKDVVFQLVPSMSSGEILLIVQPGTPNGKVQSCLAHYNHDAQSILNAPAIVRMETFDF